ncbi:MAG: MgtC/SapB family protein [Candidatus Omnitrophica bacterium]|nr:MgtC/SapB family protein [Candidatus Omnitrophota bacterium]MBI2173604.1 MgtC/SapB family protein [Candidatus Omnitrophota bacterium]
MSDWVVLQRLLLITLIAGAIGFERERHGRAAGFRTHILVGIGSCLVMLTGLFLAQNPPAGVTVDPTRMAAQVISGIGFLGAGTILRYGISVRGLTTAASLWAVGGVGLAVGAGYLRAAILTGGVVILVLFGFSRLERIMRREWYQTLIIETKGSGKHLGQIRAVLSEFDVEIRDFQVSSSEHPDAVQLELQVKIVHERPRHEFVERLRQVDGVMGVRWV